MKTETIKIDPNSPDMAVISQAAQQIEQGKLIVFPTETVYGIASRVSPDTLQHLNEVKQRDISKFYTLHIGSADQLDKYIPNINIRTKKLMNKSWPGPVTIVFELSDQDLELQQEMLEPSVFAALYKEKSLGVRCPDNNIASALLSNANVPVVAPSANPASLPPATDGEEALELLDGKVDFILDAGPCAGGKSSTVVKITDNRIDILRQGAVDSADIKSMSTINISFVCTGNTCRSPMAEAFFKHALAEKLACGIDQLDDFGYKVTSAGVMAALGQPASSEVAAICTQNGIDVSSHQSRAITQQEIVSSDYIFVMSGSHKQRIVDFYPEVAGKCKLLSVDGSDIPDPFGGDMETYLRCSEVIQDAINERLRVLLK